MKNFHLKIKQIIIIFLIIFLGINSIKAQDLRREKLVNDFLKTYDGYDELYFFKNAPIVFIGVPKEIKYFYNADSTKRFQSTLLEVSNVFKGQALIQKGTIERIDEVNLTEGIEIPTEARSMELSRTFIFDESPINKYIYFCDLNYFSPIFTNNINNKTLKYFEFAHNYKLYIKQGRYTSFPGADTTIIYNPVNQHRYKSLDELVNYINANGIAIPNVYEQGASLEQIAPINTEPKPTYEEYWEAQRKKREEFEKKQKKH